MSSHRLTWGLSSLGAPSATLAEFLDLAAGRGFRSVELRTLEGCVDLPALLAAAPGGAPAATALAVATGVRVHCLDTSFRILGHKEGDWAELLAFAELADAFGAPYLRAFDGNLGGQWDLGAAVVVLSRWQAERAARGLRAEIAIETHDALLTGARLRALAAAVPGVRVLWDTHHTWKKGGEDPLATLPAALPLAVGIHIKDSVPVPSARHPFTYVHPGRGEFPALPLLAALRNAACAVPVSLEWEKQWHPYLAPLAEAAEALDAAGWRAPDERA